MDIVNTLSGLSAISAPSGFEQTEHVAELLRPLCDDVSSDRLRNVYGRRNAEAENVPTLMLVAHLDEVGLMVTKVEEGFLRFCNIGGTHLRPLPASEVTVLTDPPMFGVISSVPPHLQSAGDHKKTFEIKDLCIDVGLPHDKAVELIPVGTPVVMRGDVARLGENRVVGKAMDDRACVAMLLRTLEILKGEKLPINLIAAISSMEEINDGGAKVAAYSEAPDYAIAIDVTFGDSPDSSGGAQTFKLNEAIPVLYGCNADRRLVRRIERVAKANDIATVREIVSGHSGTDAWPMQTVALGTATGVVSLPLRYMHTPTEVLDLRDLENGARLLAKLVLSFGEEDYDA